MRLYTFCNYYLSSIQQGIQTAHLVSELAVQAVNTTNVSLRNDFNDWARYYKTIICLNGGNCKSLDELYIKFYNLFREVYIFDQFFEDEDSLNGALTVVGIIVPERVYNYTPGLYELDSIELKLYEIISSYKLAK